DTQVEPRQMERVTVGLVSEERVSKRLGTLLTVRTSQPLVPAKLQRRGDQPRRHQETTYYVGQKRLANLALALAVVDDHTLLETWEAVLPRVLDRQLSPQT